MALVPFPSQNRSDDQSENLPAKPGGFSPFDEDEEPAGEGRMTFLEHLDELRKRITHAVGALLVGFIIAFAFIGRVQDFIYTRLTADIPGGKLIFTEPSEGFMLQIKMAALTGVLIASPYIMLQVWFFIAPGLYAKEKKLAIPFVLSSTTLFIAGAAFSHYFVFPAAWKFFEERPRSRKHQRSVNAGAGDSGEADTTKGIASLNPSRRGRGQMNSHACNMMYSNAIRSAGRRRHLDRRREAFARLREDQVTGLECPWSGAGR